ncbi:hypothetical protein M0805_009141 [Coniferiporia weirii]|nr:hypothetical protein M0805_009141 [Coniferiporia weirii]
MKANRNVALVGERVILVPYREEHVERYHAWMADAELRELTASEPLTLEEEYEMQRKWQEDQDKLTFIVLARQNASSPVPAPGPAPGPTGTLAWTECAAAQMIGDVNLFFNGSPGVVEEGEEADGEVEAEVMIAEKAYRRRGYASEALQLLLSYATSATHPPILPVAPDRLVVRIGERNTASVALFTVLGFVVTRCVEVFAELEMRLADPTAAAAARERWKRGTVVEIV